MPRPRGYITEVVPQLGSLTSAELADYLAAFRREHARTGRISGCLITGAGVVLGMVLCFAGLIFVVAIFRSLIEVSVLLAAIFAGIALIGVPWFALRHIIRERLHSRTAGFHRAIHDRLRRAPPTCVRCGYNLAGASPAEGRAGVVRCSECGLVNPLPE